ncbi:ERF family protein [Pandoraea sp. XJJ-1]|uniref:ERF family protein n=1 Tax=Pandoraea sp. XJJ-1 TaxID=3002643 RepID=UPI00227E2892|nr:ERF family protein [Pandoraea sp. XJJ-1]WAL81344.1 ERF family protein [Pandoraea sp. XJJ-1]
MTTTNKVYQAINKVQKALSETGISKDRRNQQQGYQFRGIDDVYNALSPLLAENGLCILPRMLSRSCEERQTAKGGVLFYVTVEAEFDFVSAEDGSKCVVRTYGEAMDSGDKATNKAMSAAYKYAAFQTFAIPTEGNPDADSETHSVSPKVHEEAKPRLNLDDAVVALRESDSLESLQGVFATAYKAATAQQKPELKTVYDKRKAEIETAMETA